MEIEYDNFVGEIRQRHTFAERGPAEATIHAVMRTLGEVLPQELVDQVAGFLPDQVAASLKEPPRSEKLNLSTFLDRVAERIDIDQDEALRQAQIVIGLLAELAPDDELEQVRSYMVPGFDPLFEIADRHHSQRQAAGTGGES